MRCMNCNGVIGAAMVSDRVCTCPPSDGPARTGAGPVWKGVELATLGDLFDAVVRLETPDEGQAFMRVYIAHLAASGLERPESVAFANIGYLARYGSDETFARIQRMTGAQHPIFG